MSFTLENVVPWGRSFEEYVAMFTLTEGDLQGRILGCADGPASFNAVQTQRGGRIVSVDPLYRFTASDIRRRIIETATEVLEQTRKNMHEFTWNHIKSVEELERTRLSAMELFLSDYPQGLAQGRYVDGELPYLPIEDGAFDLAVCSHLLFLYSDLFSETFHMESLRELCRVADEARVFPLLELGARTSRHLKAVTARLTEEGYVVTIDTVPYEFQRGGNQMMKIRSRGKRD